jgi:hypothetical protein
MNINWYEVWANETHDVPYLLLLRPSSNAFEILDPTCGNKKVFESRSYEDATMWLMEDEYTRVGRKELLDG